MKRGLSGKTRRGAPPLPQQRRALRVVQLSFLFLALFFGWLVFRSLEQNTAREWGEVILLSLLALLSAAAVFAMGFSLVRGPEPPEI